MWYTNKHANETLINIEILKVFFNLKKKTQFMTHSSQKERPIKDDSRKLQGQLGGRASKPARGVVSMIELGILMRR